MFRASLSFGRWHGRGFSWFKFPKHCGSVFTYKQKARQQEILSSGKSGKEIRTEAGYCISAPLSSLWHCMECRGQADGIPKQCRVFKMPSKLQLKLEVRLETELNVLEKCWFGCFVGSCWEDALFCFGTRKNCKHEKKREKTQQKNQPTPTLKVEIWINLGEFPWLARLCQGWRVCSALWPSVLLVVSAHGVRSREEFPSWQLLCSLSCHIHL